MFDVKIRLCISKSAATISSSSSNSSPDPAHWPEPPLPCDILVLPLVAGWKVFGLHRLSVSSCFALAVDFDQSIGIIFPKFPVKVHQTWHSFMISSCDRTYAIENVT